MSILSQFKQSQNTDFPNVRPSLDLRFALAKKLDPRITFTRASTATYVGSDGIMRTAAVNEPRFDHDPATGQSLGLLIEESRSNLVTDSIILSNMDDIANVTVTNNSIISPDGTQNASKIEETIVKGLHSTSRLNVTTSASTTYTISGYFKKGERNIVGISFRNNTFWGVGAPSAIFNILTGVLVGTSGTINSTSITNVGNGWYRCSVTATRDGSGTVTSGIAVTIYSNAGNNNYQGESGSGLYAWGLQMEAGAFPTSFIPTFGSQVTRSADNASMTGTNFSSWFNQTEGTVYADLRDYKSSSVGNFGISIGSASNNYFAFPYISSSGSLANGVFWKETALAKTIDFPNGGAGGKYAISYKNAQSFYGYLNGNRGDVEAPPYPNPVGYNELYIGRGHFSPTKYQNFYIRRLTYYPLALTDEQLINLTS